MFLFDFRYAPNKRWHIDTVVKVLTTVRAYLQFMSFISHGKNNKQ